jgi:hypothetical protein
MEDESAFIDGMCQLLSDLDGMYDDVTLCMMM